MSASIGPGSKFDDAAARKLKEALDGEISYGDAIRQALMLLELADWADAQNPGSDP